MKHQDSVRCDFCGSTEDIKHIHQVIGGVQRETCICQSCALILGIESARSNIKPRVGDLFAAVLDPTGVGPRDSKVCDRCGTSYARLRRTGQAGCSNCYEVFENEIDGLLRRGGNRLSHRGKLPRSLQQVRNLLVEKPELEKRLRSALDEENYEEAARLRTMIQRLDSFAGEAAGPISHDTGVSDA